MARRPTPYVDNNRQHQHQQHQQSYVSNQVHNKKRPQVLRYRKKVLDPQSPVLSTKARNDESGTTSPDNQSSHESSPVKIHPIPTASKVYVVNVQDFRFHPEHIVVERYSTIRWQIPTDSKTVYSITICSTQTTDSPTLSEDNPTFEHTFDTLGEFSYFCSLYSFMSGSVSVVTSLSAEEKSRNVCFLDYPVPKKPVVAKTSPKSNSSYPFHKQLGVWREKQPVVPKGEDDDTFAQKSRQHIKKKALKSKSSTPLVIVTTPPSPATSSSTITAPDEDDDDNTILEPLDPSATSTHEIQLEDFEFTTLHMPVVVGDSVTWSVASGNPGMVEHALQFKVVQDGVLMQTLQSTPLKPGDRWGYRVLQPCSITVECLVYQMKAEVVVHPTPVILIGDVACPVDEDQRCSTPTTLSRPSVPIESMPNVVVPIPSDTTPTLAPLEVEAPSAVVDEPPPTILQLLLQSQQKQAETRSSYLLDTEDAIPGFDAAAAYDFLKRRAHDAKQDPRVVYACSRHV
ncbi:Aste57867_14401 [Aphanomyces stellatus]|uniref:Aste57867_14401 protein n=1 Tax=Aphanomyces stellatus TaxID=120398 RepID=A0A485L1D4_9STRA|nr:hypothetical protein As57867_014347 [Aphanomyces stellatus]VFT91223.1 Aste57867_14401 [Aphanomyces stellatus]